MNSEKIKVENNSKKDVPLENWGTYLSERQWGTVREDYSVEGNAWEYFPHDHARSRTYLWGEDGLGGISDRKQNICFAFAFWNGKDPILKERLFGLTNSEGNHGEDVKELYYYLDNSPTHSYMKFLYKYPFDEFPYNNLVETNKNISRNENEFEILDTGILDNKRYFDIEISYSKNTSEDVFIKVEVFNKSDEDAELSILPTIWFRNTWQLDKNISKPILNLDSNNCIKINHPESEEYFFYFQPTGNIFFTENETNTQRIFNIPNKDVFVKDAFHEAICQNKTDLTASLNDRKTGTKASPVYKIKLKPKSSEILYLRLTNQKIEKPFDLNIESIFDQNKKNNDDFYQTFINPNSTIDQKNIQRQAFAGLLWSKQFYCLDIKKWLSKNPDHVQIDSNRKKGRNSSWKHLTNQDVISMPDCWEYPWYASWDLAFHCVPMAMVDPEFAKNQLILMMREWYMRPNGQVPAYEWNFSDINPPVQAWSALMIYYLESKIYLKKDYIFLKKIFQKLIINFTWWANREDENGNNIFSGGFLGLDNIAVLDRTNLPQGYRLEQVDATAWMAMYALNMMEIALEISQFDITFEDSITKFYEHFILISNSLNNELWDQNENFFYDILYSNDENKIPLKVRSVVGITPLFAVGVIKKNSLDKMTDFNKRKAFLDQKECEKTFEDTNSKGDILLSMLDKDRLKKLLYYLLDENEFLSVGGIRAVSKFHENNPFFVNVAGNTYDINYVPGDSKTSMFGGNSNWRGPIWIPINYLIIKSLEKYGDFYEDDFKVEFPTHSGNMLNLKQVAIELSNRIVKIFELDADNKRVVHGRHQSFYQQEENLNLVLFYEYFNGDLASGLGASHQTGWTAVISELLYNRPS